MKTERDIEVIIKRSELSSRLQSIRARLNLISAASNLKENNIWHEFNRLELEVEKLGRMLNYEHKV